MVDVTLFSLNLDNPEFTANAPFSKNDDADGTGDGGDGLDFGGSDDDDGGGPSLGPFVAGLVVLVVLALVVKKLRDRRSGGDDTADIDEVTA